VASASAPATEAAPVRRLAQRGKALAAAVKPALDRFSEHELTDRAAALTYYALMSLFPALLVGVALLGLLGEAATVDRVAKYVADQGAPPETVNAVRSSVKSAVSVHSGAGTLLLVFGLGLALYSASGAFGAAGRALNVVAGHEEDRGFVKRKAAGLLWTMVVIVLGVVALILVFLGGGVAHDLFEAIGLGSTAAGVWAVLRWPAAIGVVLLIYAIVYWAAPDERARFRPITPGAAAGVGLWGLASAGFFVYVSNFGSYNATYGAFAGVVILLVWLYLTNVALLLGAEINAALDEPPASRSASRRDA
jgi:membrane protein